MKSPLALPAAALLVACATAAGHQAAQPVTSVEMTPQQIVGARQAAYHLSGAAMGNAKGVLDAGGDIPRLTYSLRGVARWARALPTMFPDSTRGVGPTRARPEIWDNRVDFTAKAAAYADAATRLADVARGGDRAAFAAQFDATRATCQACHDVYQLPAQPQPAQTKQ
ncbi:MAG: c-type cytochrome [Sphingosinicella sp.]